MPARSYLMSLCWLVYIFKALYIPNWERWKSVSHWNNETGEENLFCTIPKYLTLRPFQKTHTYWGSDWLTVCITSAGITNPYIRKMYGIMMSDVNILMLCQVHIVATLFSKLKICIHSPLLNFPLRNVWFFYASSKIFMQNLTGTVACENNKNSL